MISFIVVGKNEGKCLKNTFNSILETIDYCNIQNYELLYIDSKSVDRSIEIVKNNFLEVKILKITGPTNSAIARNIGAKESSGEIMFFIDGDMSIRKEFVEEVMDVSGKLLFPFVSGEIKHILHNKNFKIIGERLMYGIKQDRYETQSGGIFIIKRNLWNSVKGMKTKYKRGQDLDFTLRLSKKSNKIFRKKRIIADHHTIDYMHPDRMWRMIFNGDIVYSRSVIFRDHLFNKKIYPSIIKRFFPLLLLPLSLIIGLISGKIVLSIFIYAFLHIFFITFRVLPKTKKTVRFLHNSLYYFIIDWQVIFAFLFFYPQKKEIKYTSVN